MESKTAIADTKGIIAATKKTDSLFEAIPKVATISAAKDAIHTDILIYEIWLFMMSKMLGSCLFFFLNSLINASFLASSGFGEELAIILFMLLLLEITSFHQLYKISFY